MFRKGFLLICLSALVIAAELDGLKFADQITKGKETLVLNGLGKRLATFLSIRVYVAGLYVPKKSNKTDEIVSMKGTKVIHLKFQRDVDADDIKSAWVKASKDNIKDFSEIESSLNTLNQQMVDIKEGDEMMFTFTSEGVVATVKGNEAAMVNNSKLSETLLRVFIDNPPNDELKEGLLGN